MIHPEKWILTQESIQRIVNRAYPTQNVSQPSKVLTHLLPVPLGQHGLLLPPLELARARGEAGPHLPHDLAHLVGVEVVRGVRHLFTRYGQLRKVV